MRQIFFIRSIQISRLATPLVSIKENKATFETDFCFKVPTERVFLEIQTTLVALRGDFLLFCSLHFFLPRQAFQFDGFQRIKLSSIKCKIRGLEN